MHIQPLSPESIELVSQVLGPADRTLAASFRARLSRMAFTPQQRREMERLTPGAAVKAHRAGVPSADLLRELEAAARKLALLGAEHDALIRALSEYQKLTAVLYRKVPSADRGSADRARGHIQCAIELVIHRAFLDVISAENRLVQKLVQAEASPASEQDLSSTFLNEIVQYFGASDGAVIPAHSSRTGKTAADWFFPVEDLTVRLQFEGRRRILPREAQLLDTVAERWRLALVRLRKEERMEGMSLRMLEVEELERRRISRELHDDAGQALVVVRLQLEMAEFSIPEDNAELRGRLTEIRELTEKTILSVRKLISELSPAVLEQLGMAAAVRQLVNRFQQAHDARVRLHIGKLPRVHPRLELVIYRVLQECFTNISQHSAASHINVSLTASDGEVRLDVEDDGVGFNVAEGLGRRNCYGLLGIRERVRMLGGSFSVESTPPMEGAKYHSHGTRVMIQLPVTGENPGPT